MPQTQIQEQKQEQRQQLSISAQQLLHAQLVELPLTQLAERIETEMNDNPALETKADDPDPWSSADDADDSQGETDFDSQREREDYDEALQTALEGIGRDDEELPVYTPQQQSAESQEPMVYGQSQSFYDEMLQQVGELELSPRQRYIMEYLIQSLDDDGLLRTSLPAISDELAIYHNIDATSDEIADVLSQLQQLDPPGIGARSLQECLLLQVDRKLAELPPLPLSTSDAPASSDPHAGQRSLLTLMRRIIVHHFDDFTKKHWQRIASALQLTDEQVQMLQRELRRLNPKPGASMGEVVGKGMQHITPDFIIDTQDDGTVSFQLNSGELPQLQVSQTFVDAVREYQTNREHLGRRQKEELVYMKKKVDAAQGFIEAVKMRRRTLTLTMQAIVQWQHRYFEDGDESSLRPMKLKDIAEQTGLDLSTISRVSNAKYAQTRWGILPLRHFFSDGYVTESGEELSTREIKEALRTIIEGEDKRKPLSDDALSRLLAEQGYPIARRTVAKYREQMGFPVARLRRP